MPRSERCLGCVYNPELILPDKALQIHDDGDFVAEEAIDGLLGIGEPDAEIRMAVHEAIFNALFSVGHYLPSPCIVGEEGGYFTDWNDNFKEGICVMCGGDLLHSEEREKRECSICGEWSQGTYENNKLVEYRVYPRGNNVRVCVRCNRYSKDPKGLDDNYLTKESLKELQKRPSAEGGKDYSNTGYWGVR